MAELREIEVTVTSNTKGFVDIQTAAKETGETIKRSNQEVISSHELLLQKLQENRPDEKFPEFTPEQREAIEKKEAELLDFLIARARDLVSLYQTLEEVITVAVQNSNVLRASLAVGFALLASGAVAFITAFTGLPLSVIIGSLTLISAGLLIATGHFDDFTTAAEQGFKSILDMIRPTDEQLQNIVDNMVQGAKDVDSAFEGIEFGNIPDSAFDKIKSLGDIFPDLKEQPFVPQIEFIQLPDDQQLNDFLNNEKEINDEIERGNGLIEEQSGNFSIFDGAIAMANGGLVAGAGIQREYAVEARNTTEQVGELGVGLQGAGGAADDFTDSLQQVENSGGFFQGIKDGFKQFVESVGSSTELIADFFANTLSQMSQNFSDLFFNVITGKFDNLKDLAKQAFEAILKSFLDLVSAMATRQIVISIAGLFGGSTKGAKATDLLSGAGDLAIVEEVNEIGTQTKIEQVEEGYRLAA